MMLISIGWETLVKTTRPFFEFESRVQSTSEQVIHCIYLGQRVWPLGIFTVTTIVIEGVLGALGEYQLHTTAGVLCHALWGSTNFFVTD